MAAAADVRPKDECTDVVHDGNDTDATVDYNAHGKKKCNTSGATNCYVCGARAYSFGASKVGEFSDEVSGEISDHTQRLWRKPQRRRRHVERLSFMRGYFKGNRCGSTSSGSDQSEPQDGSDNNGRRVRRRVNCIYSNSSNSDSVFQSDDSESTAYDAGEFYHFCFW